MKIILNPYNGSSISDVQLRGKKYFVEKPFEVDSMVKIEEDEVADDLLSLYEFLVFMSPEDAKKHYEDKEKRKYVCERCKNRFETEEKLEEHTEKHLAQEKLEKELGIETITPEVVEEESIELTAQDLVDQQARAEGLEGEGLRKL